MASTARTSLGRGASKFLAYASRTRPKDRGGMSRHGEQMETDLGQDCALVNFGSYCNRQQTRYGLISQMPWSHSPPCWYTAGLKKVKRGRSCYLARHGGEPNGGTKTHSLVPPAMMRQPAARPHPAQRAPKPCSQPIGERNKRFLGFLISACVFSLSSLLAHLRKLGGRCLGGSSRFLRAADEGNSRRAFRGEWAGWW